MSNVSSQTAHTQWLPGVRLKHSVPLVQYIEDCEVLMVVWLSQLSGWRLKSVALCSIPNDYQHFFTFLSQPYSQNLMFILTLLGTHFDHYMYIPQLIFSLSHTSTVRRLQWKPYKDPRDTQLVLASCSLDHSVRILQVNITGFTKNKPVYTLF